MVPVQCFAKFGVSNLGLFQARGSSRLSHARAINVEVHSVSTGKHPTFKSKPSGRYFLPREKAICLGLHTIGKTQRLQLAMWSGEPSLDQGAHVRQRPYLEQMLLIGWGRRDCDGFMPSSDMIRWPGLPSSLTVAWEQYGYVYVRLEPGERAMGNVHRVLQQRVALFAHKLVWVVRAAAPVQLHVCVCMKEVCRGQ